MLHSKFCGNQSTGTRDENHWRLFTIYGLGGQLGQVTSNISVGFYFHVPKIFYTKYDSNDPAVSEKKPVLIFICKWLWAKVEKWHWPSILPLSHLVVCYYRLSGHRLLYFLKNPLFSLFPIENHKFKIWTCRKISKGQPRVIIWTHYDG